MFPIRSIRRDVPRMCTLPCVAMTKHRWREIYSGIDECCVGCWRWSAFYDASRHWDDGHCRWRLDNDERGEMAVERVADGDCAAGLGFPL